MTPFLSDIAMKIAVEMEAQAALRTTTAEKAEAICAILSAVAPPPSAEEKILAVAEALRKEIGGWDKEQFRKAAVKAIEAIADMEE